jgi:very-short-patch-repair endonuclease
MNKYGVNWPAQRKEVQDKKMKSGYLANDYILPSGNIIRIQGYEYKFLDESLKYYTEDMFDFELQTIPYVYESKLHQYFPDFYIKQINHIIEVKSNYTFYADYDKNIAKSLGVVASGKYFTFAIYRENSKPSYISVSQEVQKIENSLDNNNLKYEKHKQFDNYIVDYYIENNKIAICYRDIKFTNEYFLDTNYFYDMYSYFEEKGIQLIVVNNLEINDVWINSLLSKLIKNNEKVYARNCIVKEINNSPFQFLNKHHIQGFVATSIKLGLYYNEELVGIMCFNKFRHGIGKDRGDSAYELVRYATSQTITAGASKLISHFIKKYNPTLIYSYSDNSISNGNMYKILGFNLEKINKSDYKYNKININKLYHRFGFRKGNLKNKLAIYDENKSEHELMLLNGYYRLFDSGKKTWVLNLRKEEE